MTAIAAYPKLLIVLLGIVNLLILIITIRKVNLAMRNFFIIICFCALSNNRLFGQNKKYKVISDAEIELIYNVTSLAFTDYQLPFIFSPLITSSVNLSFVNIPNLITKYDFDKNQLEGTLKDTILIPENKYFNVINQDSLEKYFRHRDWNQFEIHSFIKKFYHRDQICYVSNIVLSRNGMYAIVEYFIWCGSLCGRGETVLMRKIRDQWIKVETLNNTVS